MADSKILFKVLKMRAGEEIITGVREMVDEQDRPVCFEIYHPYVLDLIPSEEKDVDEVSPLNFRVNYVRWFPVSKNPIHRIPFDSVVSMNDPDDALLKTYTDKFGHFFEGLTYDDNTVPTSDSSDSPEGSGVSDSGDRGEGGES